ncbi:MAG TPA: alginate export family protein [Candidatus Omnitrophota bacterium]|nr:alginate export family protein [Candidatus Omnitrophota bacterium]HPD84266.1 alginate export family protein [Candidatus Omnitrophota bacterium]HRZ03122.1 alginate export family protein [Candidatus Omnitrophota bacterium]
MKKIAVVMVLALLGFIGDIWAEAKTETKAEVAKKADEMKFKFGSSLRLRHEYWKNWRDEDSDQHDDRNFFRIKSSVWGQLDVNPDLLFYMKLTNEFKAYTMFEGASSGTPDKSASKKGYHFDINEIVFDNLYTDIKNFVGLPIDWRLGRQDFLGTYGEGFLIMDGTPQDGSRTFYFNAAKASWRVNDKNTLDFIYINDPRDDEFLPAINRLELTKISNPNDDKVPQNLNTTDEQAYVLYLKNKNIKDLGLEGYYIFKKEAEEGGTGMQSKETRLSTLGSYAKYDLNPWTLRGQFAGQFGEYGEKGRLGYGGYGFVDRVFKDVRWSPKASAGYIYLSGDDLTTARNEAWDPLFSRWPWMSELYILSMAGDSNVGILGYWTNLSMWRTEFSFKPTGKTKVTLWYNYLKSNHVAPGNTICSGTGRDRGHLPQFRVDYAWTKNVSMYFLAEYLLPGDFYVSSDEAWFLRSEMQLKF